MGKGYLKRKKALKSTELRGPCYYEGCTKQGKRLHECVTCEKRGDVFRVQCCDEHYLAGRGVVRKHALVKHPANVLRVIAAGLRGEDIT